MNARVWGRTMRTVDEVVAEVMAVHAGKISTHSDRCYRYHAGCLAFLIRDLLDAEWEGITVRGLPTSPGLETDS